MEALMEDGHMKLFEGLEGSVDCITETTDIRMVSPVCIIIELCHMSLVAFVEPPTWKPEVLVALI